MTTKRTNKKAPQQPAKQSHFCDVLMAAQAVNSLYISLGFRLESWQINSILAGIFLPSDASESPCTYFDFKGMGLSELDAFLRNLREAPSIKTWADPNLKTIYSMLKWQFPPVKLA